MVMGLVLRHHDAPAGATAAIRATNGSRRWLYHDGASRLVYIGPTCCLLRLQPKQPRRNESDSQEAFLVAPQRRHEQRVAVIDRDRQLHK